MTKRQFYAKALLVSLPIAKDLAIRGRRIGTDTAGIGQRIGAIAAQLAENATLEWETQLVIWDEIDEDSGNKLDPDYVDSRRDPDEKQGGAKN